MPTRRDLWFHRQFRELGKTPLPVHLFTLGTIFAIYGLEAEVRTTYFILLVGAAWSLAYYGDYLTADGGSRRGIAKVLFPPFYTIQDVVVPAMLWASIVGGIMLALEGFLEGFHGFTTASGPDNFQLAVTELWVGLVESFLFRWVWFQVYGGIIPQIAFAFLHPQVRDNFLSNPVSTLPFILYYFVFGLIFQEMVIRGQASDVPEWQHRIFGLRAEIGAHSMFNLMVILFPNLVVMSVVLRWM